MPSSSNDTVIKLAERWKNMDFGILSMDELNIKILDELLADCRAPNVEIAKRLRVNESTVRHRIGSLERKGVIRGYSARIDYGVVERPVKAYVGLKVDNEHRPKAIRKLSQHPRSLAVYRVSGAHDLLCVMLFLAMDELEEFTSKYVQMEGVRDVRTEVVLNPYKGAAWSGA